MPWVVVAWRLFTLRRENFVEILDAIPVRKRLRLRNKVIWWVRNAWFSRLWGLLGLGDLAHFPERGRGKRSSQGNTVVCTNALSRWDAVSFVHMLSAYAVSGVEIAQRSSLTFANWRSRVRFPLPADVCCNYEKWRYTSRAPTDKLISRPGI